MNSRERLLKVLEGRPTDRVPISTYELCGYNSKAFENNEPSYQRLMNYIRQNTDCIAMWNPDSNQQEGLSSFPTRANEEVKKGKDFIEIKETIQTPKGSLERTTKQFDNVHTVWKIEPLCKTMEDVDRYLSIPYEPVQYDYSDYERIQSEVGNRGIIMASLADPVCIAMEMMEFGQATIWAMTETYHFQRTLDQIYQRTMTNLENMLKGGVVDLYRICGAEYMTPPYMPPEFFKRFVLPYERAMTEIIHRYGGKVRIHSHGKIRRIIDFILETGADAVDPCEGIPDGDISLNEVKEAVGKKLCIFGNLQLKMLENATSREVQNEVAFCMEAAKQGGKYVIMPTASPINVPLSPQTEENYMVFIDTALNLGKYI